MLCYVMLCYVMIVNNMLWARKKSAILTSEHAHQGKTGMTGWKLD